MRSDRGIVPPLVTPLTEKGRLDLVGLECLIEHVVAGGVHGLFILGTTGEGPSLCCEVRREMIRHTCRIARGRLPVYVGISDTAIIESVSLARFAADAGCDFVVVTPPYYFPVGQVELTAYFRQLLAELPLPTMLYNMPSVTGLSIDPETVRSLLDQEKVVGLKDSSGDLNYFKEILKIASVREDFSVMVGPEHLLAQTLALGGDGGVAGGANIWPSIFVDLYEASVSDESVDISPLNSSIVQLGEIYKVGPESITATIARTKMALSICQICTETTAPPILPTNSKERERISQILVQLGRIPGQSHAGIPQSQIA